MKARRRRKRANVGELSENAKTGGVGLFFLASLVALFVVYKK